MSINVSTKEEESCEAEDGRIEERGGECFIRRRKFVGCQGGKRGKADGRTDLPEILPAELIYSCSFLGLRRLKCALDGLKKGDGQTRRRGENLRTKKVSLLLSSRTNA